MVNMWCHISLDSYLITLLDMLGDASFDYGHTECGSPCQIFDCDSLCSPFDCDTPWLYKILIDTPP